MRRTKRIWPWRSSWRSLIADLGHQAFRVRDGRQALQAMERLCPDVLLLDLSMPELCRYHIEPMLQRPSPAYLSQVDCWSFKAKLRMHAART